MRPRDDHPRRAHRRERHAGRAAPPHADHDRGRATARRPGRTSRSSRVSCRPTLERARARGRDEPRRAARPPWRSCSCATTGGRAARRRRAAWGELLVTGAAARPHDAPGVGLGLVVAVVVTAASYANLYATRPRCARCPQARRQRRHARDLRADLRRLGRRADRVAAGGIALALVALMTTCSSSRHTRAEEEAGRAELVGRGRRRPPRAAGRGAARRRAGELALGAVVALAAVATGSPAAGSLALGLAFARRRVVFAAVAAVAAQVTETREAANGLAAGVLGASFVVRAIGDAGPTGCRGCRRSAGASRSGRSPTSAGGSARASSRCRRLTGRDRGRAARPARPRCRAPAAAPRPGARRLRSRSRSPGACSAARWSPGRPRS